MKCAWCDQEFIPRNRYGPVPRYCRASCRQRAYEARRLARYNEERSSKRVDALIGWCICIVLFTALLVAVNWTGKPAVVLVAVILGGLGGLSLWGSLRGSR